MQGRLGTGPEASKAATALSRAFSTVEELTASNEDVLMQWANLGAPLVAMVRSLLQEE